MDGGRPASRSSGSLFGPGDLVRARFRIAELLGQGGMAEVYRADDLASGRVVALKMVLPELLGNAKTRARFEREVAWTRGIRHPNVIRIHELIYLPAPEGRPSNAEIPCVVMEFLEGVSLADHLEMEGPMECEEALPIALQLASALAAAHRVKVVHRDLKPDNIFLEPPKGPGEEGRVVLTDFGVARHSEEPAEGDPDLSKDSLTASNLIVGTPEYMAPEVLDLEDAIPSSDIYSLGLVAYEMVIGVRPFEDAKPLEALFKRVRQPAPSPLEMRPDLDPRCVRLIETCLRRRPADRFASAEELIREIDGEDSRYLQLVGRFQKEHLVLAGVALLMVALVILVVVISAGR